MDMHMIIWITVLFCGISALQQRKNVLFLVADDMRPNINAYENPIGPKMHTPNLDALAAKSLLLKRAYVQQALCSPSRTSLLTGRRPDTTHVYDLNKYFREVGGNFTTLPEYFKQNGYESIGIGKIFHPGVASNNDDPPSWSVPYYHAPNYDYWSTYNVSWRAVDEETRRKKPLPDCQLAQRAIKTLKQLSQTPDQPFFLGVGIRKPHLPYVFPEEFLSYYPPDSVFPPSNQYAPVNMPDIAWFDFALLRSYKDIKALNASGAINTTFPLDTVIELRRAYYSAISYTDYLIGKVIDALEKYGFANNTIISFLGDHGYLIGEHGEWLKRMNFELSVNAPMMIHVPGLTEEGIVTDELTEFVDLFPTLADLAGLPSLPLCPLNSSQIKLCTEGTSLVNFITNKKSFKWKDRVFSQNPRDDNQYMGYTMRTDKFRYTEWVRFLGAPHYKPVWEDNVGTELYDHRVDPEENYNHAGEEAYRDIQQQLSKQLREGWRATLTVQMKDIASYSENLTKHVHIMVFVVAAFGGLVLLFVKIL